MKALLRELRSQTRGWLSSPPDSRWLTSARWAPANVVIDLPHLAPRVAPLSCEAWASKDATVRYGGPRWITTATRAGPDAAGEVAR
jgi:hypothetical protein